MLFWLLFLFYFQHERKINHVFMTRGKKAWEEEKMQMAEGGDKSHGV